MPSTDELYQTIINLQQQNHQQHAAVMKSIGAVEEKTDAVLRQATATNGRVSDLEDKADETDKRIGKVESKMNWLSGAAAAVGAVAGWFHPGK